MSTGLKRRYISFSCGHKDYITYRSTTDLLKQMERAQKKGLCSECKRKALLEDSTVLNIPYGDFKRYFARKRNVVAGEYNKETGTITVTAPNKLVQNYNDEKNRVYYDMKLRTDENGTKILTVFLKGDSYRLKDEVKKLGFRWKDKQWCKDVVVFLGTVWQTGKEGLPVPENPELYDLLDQLNALGCVEYITELMF